MAETTTEETGLQKAERYMEDAYPGFNEAYRLESLRRTDHRLYVLAEARKCGRLVDRPARAYPRRSKLRTRREKWDRHWDNNGRRKGRR